MKLLLSKMFHTKRDVDRHDQDVMRKPRKEKEFQKIQNVDEGEIKKRTEMCEALQVENEDLKKKLKDSEDRTRKLEVQKEISQKKIQQLKLQIKQLKDILDADVNAHINAIEEMNDAEKCVEEQQKHYEETALGLQSEPLKLKPQVVKEDLQNKAQRYDNVEEETHSLKNAQKGASSKTMPFSEKGRKPEVVTKIEDRLNNKQCDNRELTISSHSKEIQGSCQTRKKHPPLFRSTEKKLRVADDVTIPFTISDVMGKCKKPRRLLYDKKASEDDPDSSSIIELGVGGRKKENVRGCNNTTSIDCSRINDEEVNSSKLIKNRLTSNAKLLKVNSSDARKMSGTKTDSLGQTDEGTRNSLSQNLRRNTASEISSKHGDGDVEDGGNMVLVNSPISERKSRGNLEYTKFTSGLKTKENSVTVRNKLATNILENKYEYKKEDLLLKEGDFIENSDKHTSNNVLPVLHKKLKTNKSKPYINATVSDNLQFKKRTVTKNRRKRPKINEHYNKSEFEVTEEDSSDSDFVVTQKDLALPCKNDTKESFISETQYKLRSRYSFRTAHISEID